MRALYHFPEDLDEAPYKVQDRVNRDIDGVSCDAGIVCGRDRQTWIGYVLDSEDAGYFRPLGALWESTAEEPLLVCEDCFGWLEAVFNDRD